MVEGRACATLGKTSGTVTDWGTSPPRYAIAYLELAIELKRIRDIAGPALERTR